MSAAVDSSFTMEERLWWLGRIVSVCARHHDTGGRRRKTLPSKTFLSKQVSPIPLTITKKRKKLFGGTGSTFPGYGTIFTLSYCEICSLKKRFPPSHHQCNLVPHSRREVTPLVRKLSGPPCYTFLYPKTTARMHRLCHTRVSLTTCFLSF